MRGELVSARRQQLLEQRRCGKRGDHHHHEKGAVKLRIEDAAGEAHLREDESDLAAWNHADANDDLSTMGPKRREAGDELAGDGDGNEGGAEKEDCRVGKGGDFYRGAHRDEEDRDEKDAERDDAAADGFALGSATQDEAGRECANDRRRSDGGSEDGQRKSEDDGHDGHGIGFADALHEPEQRRNDDVADDYSRDEKAECDDGSGQHTDGGDGFTGDQLGNDGEDDETEHVVDDGGAENDLAFV